MSKELEQALEIIAKQAKVIERLERENKQLRQRVDQLVRYIHGSKSEKRSPGQLELFEPEATEPEAPEDPPPPEKTPRKRAKKQSPLKGSIKDLPTTTEELIPDEVRANPEAYRRLGNPDITTELRFQPASYTRHLIIRHTFVLKEPDDESSPMRIAPLPPRLLPGCVLGPSMLAGVITGKYCWHLPLYRQELMMRAARIECSRSLLCHWMKRGAQLLEKLYEHLKKKLLAENYLQADETPIDYLAPGSGKTKQGYLWVLNHPQTGIYYEWHTGRSQTHLQELMEADDPFHGILQTDGYAPYATFVEASQGAIQHLSCTAHIRRGFIEAEKDRPELAAWFLEKFRRLYRIEAELREIGASSELRRRRRRNESHAIYQLILKAVEKLSASSGILPKSPMGKALKYARDQLPKASLWLENGHTEIDNNLAENGIRPTKLGLKNWLFFGSAESGRHSAILYTMVENVRRLNRDPYQYLEWVFGRLPDLAENPTDTELEKLLPAAWAKATPNIPQLRHVA